MEWTCFNEIQAQAQAQAQTQTQSYYPQPQPGLSRCDIDDLASANFEALSACREWHLTESQIQARRAKIEALKAASVDWPRMNESQIQRYRELYGTDMNDMTDMPYMGAAEFKALTDAIGLPPPLASIGIQPGSDIGVPKGTMFGPSYRPYVRGPEYDEKVKEMARDIRNSRNLNFANVALEFYEKCQGAEFVIVEPLYSEYAMLAVPKADPRYPGSVPPDVEECCHVSFLAKPKNCEWRADVSPKYFFGELLKDQCSGTYYATYCSTFEPSQDPGFNHGCVFCPVDEKFHPAPRGYRHGHPPCYVLEGLYY